jgi:membrane protease YdiL (CAAX protease family)
MNIKRAIGFSVLLYTATFVVYIITTFIPGLGISEAMTTGGYVIYWLLLIPIVLLLAKWFFKKDPPNTRKGFLLGVVAILVSLVLDGVSVLLTVAVGESTQAFQDMYADWRFYATIVWVIVLTTFAGFEFDKTYTNTEAKKM